MTATATPSVRIVLYEGTGSLPLEDSERSTLTAQLLDRGFRLTCTGRNGNRVAEGATQAAGEDFLLVLGRFEKGTPPHIQDAEGRVGLELREIGDRDTNAVMELVEEVLKERELEPNAPGKWKPWFPVIDYTRCTNCMQCLSFCLFDVYGVSEKAEIQVQNHSNCKTDCPACSRVCPEVAIMFPKYAGDPINGAVVSDSDVQREAMKVDISALLGGDIYATLKKRHSDAKERFARERDEKRAISERMRCLKKLAGEMEIPMEVLKSLPAQEEVQRKAEAAQQAARDARAQAP